MTPVTTRTKTSPLSEEFSRVRRQTEDLCLPLSPEDMMVQSCAEASPAKWHLAHTTWFFETFLLREFLPGYREFHPDFRWLFNSYYNSVSDQPDKKLRASFSRPPVEAIFHFFLLTSRIFTLTPFYSPLPRQRLSRKLLLSFTANLRVVNAASSFSWFRWKGHVRK